MALNLYLEGSYYHVIYFGKENYICRSERSGAMVGIDRHVVVEV